MIQNIFLLIYSTVPPIIQLNWQVQASKANSIMVKKIKSDACQGRWCQQHLFSIQPYIQNNNHAIHETLRLCPKSNKTTKLFQKVTPQLNLDSKYYTPFFILQQDQRLYVNHDDHTLRNFANNQFQQQYEISQIVRLTLMIPRELFSYLPQYHMIPRTGLGKRYCKVCKDDYDDYLEHISSQSHCNRLSANPYSGFIVELEQTFKLHHKPQQQDEINLLPKALNSFQESQMETDMKLRQNANSILQQNYV